MPDPELHSLSFHLFPEPKNPGSLSTVIEAAATGTACGHADAAKVPSKGAR